MLASIPSASLLGASGYPGHRRGPRRQGPARLPHRRPARRSVPRVARPGPGRRDELRTSSGRTKCITVNLAPSGQRKIGAGLDLAIAVGVLVAIRAGAAETLVGGLGVRRRARPRRLAAAGAGRRPDGRRARRRRRRRARRRRRRGARRGRRGDVRVASTLTEVVAALTRRGAVARRSRRRPSPPTTPPLPDLADVRGQPVARRALEIAAAGGHHLLMVGSPGSGKTMLAQRLPGLLPPLDRAESLAATMVHSAAGLALPPGGLIVRRRRSVPRTTRARRSRSSAAARRRCGRARSASATAACSSSTSSASSRPPRSTGCASRWRRASSASPAPTPGPCCRPASCSSRPPTRARAAAGRPGWCECDEVARLRYLRRLSGPLLDRFDLRVAVQRPDGRRAARPGGGEPSAVVAAACRRSRATLAIDRAGRLNAELHGELLDEYAPLTAAARAVLRSRSSATA